MVMPANTSGPKPLFGKASLGSSSMYACPCVHMRVCMYLRVTALMYRHMTSISQGPVPFVASQCQHPAAPASLVRIEEAVAAAGQHQPGSFLLLAGHQGTTQRLDAGPGQQRLPAAAPGLCRPQLSSASIGVLHTMRELRHEAGPGLPNLQAVSCLVLWYFAASAWQSWQASDAR